MDDIPKIYQSEPVSPNRTDTGSQERKKQKKKKTGQEVKKHFDTLTRIVEDIHRELESKDSPFRLCIYQEGEDVFIDIVTIDETGKIDKTFKHDVSHAELEELVRHIKSGRGLILDTDV